jgi:hypothetical protein
MKWLANVVRHQERVTEYLIPFLPQPSHAVFLRLTHRLLGFFTATIFMAENLACSILERH